MKKLDNKYTVLAIETTGKICGVSLITNNKIIYENNINSGLNHSVTLFNNINDALEATKTNISKINEIKVSNGPGSFTGIRIGVAAAIGLSEKYNTKISYVDTLDGLAYNIKNKGDVIISMIDAKYDRDYISIYFSSSLKKVYKDYIINVYDLCDMLNKNFKNCNIEFSFIGDGAVNYKNIITSNLNINYKIYTKYSSLKSSSIGFVDGEKFLKPDINYLIKPKAERERNGFN